MFFFVVFRLRPIFKHILPLAEQILIAIEKIASPTWTLRSLNTAIVVRSSANPVKKICTLDEAYVEAGLADLCPWPKQLYLKDTLTMISKFKSDWDLAEFPFDKQTLSGTITLVDNIAFSEDKPRVKLKCGAQSRSHVLWVDPLPRLASVLPLTRRWIETRLRSFTSALDEYNPVGNALAGLFPVRR